MDVRSLSAGLYILQVITDKEQITQKILIEK
jgi:hypothetical protein